MKKTTFIFWVLLLICLGILYNGAHEGDVMAIATLAGGATAALIVLGGGMILAFSYIQGRIEETRNHRYDVAQLRREVESQVWQNILSQTRSPQLPVRDSNLQLPAQTFSNGAEIPDWLREVRQ